MSSFILIPGAGGAAWYWHRVIPLLERADHEALAVDLPSDDERAGLTEYATKVAEAVGSRRDVVLVAQSLGGFTAPLVCELVTAGSLVLVNAMIPDPGETPGEWWDNTGWEAARTAAAHRSGYSAQFDAATYFLHDIPGEIAAEGRSHQRNEAANVFEDRCVFKDWPDIPIHVIAGSEDRFFPLEFQRSIARDRLHRVVDEVAGGHLVALSNPRALTDRLLQYVGANALEPTEPS
jgi:pimeloyl-ACP methyl ester carboxylesterase